MQSIPATGTLSPVVVQASVDEEFTKTVGLSDLFFLRDSKSSRRYPQFVTNDLVDLFFGVWTVGPSSSYLSCFRVSGGLVDRGADFVAEALGHLFLQAFSGCRCGHG